MRRRLEPHSTFNVWPAFTDVLGGLVVFLVFLVTIFVIGEVLLGREMTGKDTAIGQLAQIISDLEGLVGETRSENAALIARVSSLESAVGDRDALIQRLETDKAESLARQQALETDNARAEASLTEQNEQLSAMGIRVEHLAAELDRLNRALYGTRQELAARNDELAERNAVVEAQSARIEEMDDLIKRRLLDRVEELEQYASDFYGRLREVFADNPDIKVEGDRFVFQSEVLFDSGEADLTTAGGSDLDKFIEVYRQVEPQLPADLPVIIEVQGHTDSIPISNERFASNWELSVHRALGVVRYFIRNGVPPERLAAVGMGEYHPIDPGTSDEAYRRNRRIELKITSR